jgi:cytochrome c-type biogenesis protein
MSGLISFISPCMLPLIPAYVGYMGNRVTAQEVSGAIFANDMPASTTLVRQHRFQMALHGMAFVLGFMVVFVGFGRVITAGTQIPASIFYEAQHLIIPRVGGVVIILFGLHFLGLLVPALHWLACRIVLDRLGPPGRAIRRGLEWLQGAPENMRHTIVVSAYFGVRIRRNNPTSFKFLGCRSSLRPL